MILNEDIQHLKNEIRNNIALLNDFYGVIDKVNYIFTIGGISRATYLRLQKLIYHIYKMNDKKCQAIPEMANNENVSRMEEIYPTLSDFTE